MVTNCAANAACPLTSWVRYALTNSGSRKAGAGALSIKATARFVSDAISASTGRSSSKLAISPSIADLAPAMVDEGRRAGNRHGGPVALGILTAPARRAAAAATTNPPVAGTLGREYARGPFSPQRTDTHAVRHLADRSSCRAIGRSSGAAVGRAPVCDFVHTPAGLSGKTKAGRVVVGGRLHASNIARKVDPCPSSKSPDLSYRGAAVTSGPLPTQSRATR